MPSEQLESESSPKRSENARTLLFMVFLSLVCAIILSLLASALQKPKEEAKELDRSKEMMIAAKVMNHNGNFFIQNDNGEYIPAKFEEGGRLVPGSDKDIATKSEILSVLKKRFIPILVDNQGNIKTFKEAGINEQEYISAYKKSGYYAQPEKLIYEILPNPAKNEPDPKLKPIGYVIPVNGFGLWDAIYGYLAIKPDGNTVIGISWYDQKETPGLGANIAEESWQSLFPGKQIFQPDPSGKADVKTAPLGITVVKGKVSEVLGESPKSKTAVDGMAGATLTGNGVTDAYRNVLSAYRPFLIKLNEEFSKQGSSIEEKKP